MGLDGERQYGYVVAITIAHIVSIHRHIIQILVNCLTRLQRTDCSMHCQMNFVLD